jgi:hypothetical protein
MRHGPDVVAENGNPGGLGLFRAARAEGCEGHDKEEDSFHIDAFVGKDKHSGDKKHIKYPLKQHKLSTVSVVFHCGVLHLSGEKHWAGTSEETKSTPIVSSSVLEYVGRNKYGGKRFPSRTPDEKPNQDEQQKETKTALSYVEEGLLPSVHRRVEEGAALS